MARALAAAMSEDGTSGSAVRAYLMTCRSAPDGAGRLSPALKPPSQGVREIPEQRVDELLKIVPLVCPDRDEVVEDLVVAPGMEMVAQGCQSLGLGKAEANGITKRFWTFAL